MAKSSATRQAEYRARKAAHGLVTATGLVHDHQRADVLALLRALALNPSLEVGPLRDTSSGKLVSLKSQRSV